MRIRVRDLSINDVKIINKWHNNKSLFNFLVGDFYGPTEEETIKWIKKYQDENQTFRGIVCDDNKQDIGVIYLISHSSAKEAEFGFFIADKKNRQKGYGKEMIEWMLNFGFNVLKLDKIFLYVLKRNKVAYNLYKQFGFIEDNKLSFSAMKNGKTAKVLHMFRKKGKTK